MPDDKPPARYWLVWEDDTPTTPEHPMLRDDAIAEFRQACKEDPEAKVEIRQCSPRELEWAGIGTTGDDEDKD